MAFIASLSIHGFRGFGVQRTFSPAIPNGTPGSGLSILVGPNNAGKSSITESVVAATQDNPPNFHVGQRNSGADNRVRIELTTVGGVTRVLRTVDAGGSPSMFEGGASNAKVYCVPSRRQFASAFGEDLHSREDYSRSIRHQPSRQQTIPLHARLQRIARDPAQKALFDNMLAELMGYRPNWTIEQHETSQHFLKYTIGTHSHSSDGLGDGIVGLFSIAAAVFEDVKDTVLVIDEPELSLHPQFQRRVIRKLVSLSANCQIIIATHSPLLIDWRAISDGATVVRVVREEEGIQLYPLSNETRQSIRGLLADQNNPHVLGLDASEVFFYEDRILLVEGQEDVILLPTIATSVGVPLRHPLFGWGVGGANKMAIIASMLRDLGFRHLVGLLDRDKAEVQAELAAEFPHYSFHLLPADDIRTKPEKTTPAKQGLLDDARQLRPELKDDFIQLLNTINHDLDL